MYDYDLSRRQQQGQQRPQQERPLAFAAPPQPRTAASDRAEAKSRLKRARDRLTHAEENQPETVTAYKARYQDALASLDAYPLTPAERANQTKFLHFDPHRDLSGGPEQFSQELYELAFSLDGMSLVLGKPAINPAKLKQLLLALPEEKLKDLSRLYVGRHDNKQESFFVKLTDLLGTAKAVHLMRAINMPLPIDGERLTYDAFIEQLTVRLAYMNDAEFSDHDDKQGAHPAKLLTAFGYTAEPLVLGKWGLQFRVFRPDGKHEALNAKYPQVILALRGTEGIGFDVDGAAVLKKLAQQAGPPNTAQGADVQAAIESGLDTLVGDGIAAGIGLPQFDQNQALIAQWVQHAAQLSATGKLWVSGHSLGGALAQIVASRFEGSVSRVVTFESAGVNQKDVQSVAKNNRTHAGDSFTNNVIGATHYRVRGDIVPNGGDGFLPGIIQYFDRLEKGKNDAGFTSSTALRPGHWADFATKTHVAYPLTAWLGSMDPGNLTAQQKAILQYGVKDRQYTEHPGTQVQMNYEAQEHSDFDPRLSMETARDWAALLDMTKDLYAGTFQANVAYNLLLEEVENRVKQIEDPKDLDKVRAWLNSGEAAHLPLSENAKRLAIQMGLPDYTEDFDHPFANALPIPSFAYKASFYKMAKDKGVEIPARTRDSLNRQLLQIWQRWHPGKKR